MSSSPEGIHGSDIHSVDSSDTASEPDIVTSSESSQETVCGFDDTFKSEGTTPSSVLDKEKAVPEYTSSELGPEVTQDELGDDDPALKDIPWHVRRVVSLHDDPTLPTITFRYFILSFLFIAPGAFLAQMSEYRTTFAPYSIFFVQIGANYVGDWLAKCLPAWEIRIPFTKRSFNLNPGPFSVKEHVLVTITAASGATSNLAWTPISLSELYFNHKINPAVAILFMWAVVWTGYSYAALARQFLIYDPQYPWFQALCQTALFETQKKQRESPSPMSRRQMMIFFFVLVGIFFWQFLPEFVFPMMGSLAFLCWVAPHSATANFIGSGFGGMGFMNLSFDWSNVGYLSQMGSMFLTPFWTQVIVFSAFVVNCWILIPASKWGGLGRWHEHLMSNRLFMENGTVYPVLSLITPQISLNETAYAEYGPIYVGAQLLWGTFFDYASYTSAICWMLLFGYPQIKSIITKQMERRRNPNVESANEQYDDQLNILMRSYKEVPFWWFIALFTCSFVAIIIMLARGQLFIPIWTYFLALATGAIVVIPLGWLYALSNFQLPIGSTNQVLYGLMVNSVKGYKNPVGASTYGAIAGDAWYRAMYMLQDQKIGHYMHIPPRTVFFSQIFGSFIGVPINYGCIRWILNTKFEYLNGNLIDPMHQWTGQSLASSLTLGTQYVLIGPKRMFAQALYKPLPYAFLVGALTPTVLYTLHRCFPRAKFHLWNCTIFFCTMSNFWGNISTGYVSGIIGGFVVMYWAYRHHYEIWARYNYILAAAFDAGFNFNMLAIFLCFGAGKIVTMPNWWGNNADNVERCFALPPQ